MSNSEASGKDRRMRKLEKQQQAALKSETPATPPQDAEPEKPAVPDTPESTPTPQEKVKKDEPKQALDVDDVDYKDAYRRANEELRKERERNKTLQSKYNAEVPRLSKEVKELKAKLEHGEGTSDTVAEVMQSDDYKRLVEEWDQETANRIVGIAKHFAQGAKPEPPVVEPEPEPVPEPTGPNGYDEFVITLDSQMPGWDLKYNENPEFIKWATDNTEPLSGKSYLDLLNRAANETFDVSVARNIFSAFDRQVSQKSADPVETYVEPTGGGSGTTQPEAPTYKESDLQAMATKLRKGQTTYEDFESFRAKYTKALNAGRVQLGQ